MSRKVMIGDPDDRLPVPGGKSDDEATSSPAQPEVEESGRDQPDDALDQPSAGRPMTKGAPGWAIKPPGVFIDRTKKRQP